MQAPLAARYAVPSPAAPAGQTARRSEGRPATRPDPALPHVVDATMFWSETGGGVRRYLLTKATWLTRQAKWRHTVLAPGLHGLGQADSGGVSLPLPGGYRLPLSRKAGADALMAQAPDLIEVGDPYRLAWSALDAGQRLGVPTVAFCHSDLGAMAARALGGEGACARAARRAADAYVRHVYREFDVVMAPSRSMAQRLLDAGVPGVRVQPLGVDSHEFHPRRRDPVWRHTLGLEPDQRALLYVGRFAPEKNLQRLVAAVQRLGPRYRLLAVGSGPTPPRGECVRVLPFESRTRQLARIYASADGFVHAGDQETFGLAVLEAMASGLPVAVQARAGLAELVAGGAGIGVASERSGDWAEAIAALFASERESLVKAGRAQAEAHDWQRVMPALVHRYEQLMSAHDNAAVLTQPAVSWRSGRGAPQDRPAVTGQPTTT
jgi:alpha-1,6-mannosyltransferase